MEDGSRSSQSLLEVVIEQGKLAYRVVKLEHRKDESQVGAERECPGIDLRTPQQQEQRNRNGSEEIHQRRTERGGAHPAQVGPEQPSRGFTKARALPALHAERLHDAIACNSFLHDVLDVGELV